MENLVGKTVTVRILDRDEKGKEIKGKYTTIKGKCTFYGKNFFDQECITLDRTPIVPITKKDIIKIC